MQIHFHAASPSLWIKVSLPILVQERGEIHATFTKENACFAFRESRKDREVFLYLSTRNCLQLQIILCQSEIKCYMSKSEVNIGTILPPNPQTYSIFCQFSDSYHSQKKKDAIQDHTLHLLHLFFIILSLFQSEIVPQSLLDIHDVTIYRPDTQQNVSQLAFV